MKVFNAHTTIDNKNINLIYSWSNITKSDIQPMVSPTKSLLHRTFFIFTLILYTSKQNSRAIDTSDGHIKVSRGGGLTQTQW